MLLMFYAEVPLKTSRERWDILRIFQTETEIILHLILDQRLEILATEVLISFDWA